MIIDFLNKQDNFKSDRPALICNQVKLTYNELDKRIQQTAAQLTNLGIKANSHISILSENNRDYIILILALWEISAVPIPLNTRLTDQELEDLIIHSNCEVKLGILIKRHGLSRPRPERGSS